MARRKNWKAPKQKRPVYRRKVVKKSGQPTRDFAKMVRRVLATQSENKVRQAQGSYAMRYMSDNINDTMIQSNLIPISPYPSAGLAADETIAIVQGSGSNQRIGNSIRTRRAILRGVFYPLKYNATNNPQPVPMEIMLIIFKIKGQGVTGQNGDDLYGAQHLLNNHAYQYNYSTTQSSLGVNGELITLTRAFNNDAIQICYKRVFKLGNSGISTSLSGDRQNQQQYVNNDFKLNCKFNINVTKYLSKVYKFNDNDTTTSNRNTYAFWMPLPSDGYDLNNNGIFPAQCDWNLTYEYEDN